MIKIYIYLSSFFFFYLLSYGSNEKLLTEEKQLTFSGLRSGEGYFSADDSKLVYQAEKLSTNPFYQIYLLDLSTGKNSQISSSTGKATCAWIHPDGDKILFASTFLDKNSLIKQETELKKRKKNLGKKYAWDYDKNYDLFIKEIDSGAVQQITDSVGYDAEGAISPDGEKIIFSSNREYYKKGGDESKKEDLSFYCDIFLHNIDKNETIQLTDEDGYDGGPFFNSDGTKICWRRFSKNGHQAEIYTMDLKSRKEKQITNLGAMSWAPFFHPSDDYIIFATNLHGFNNFELYIIDSNGRGDPIRVTHRDGFDGLPSFSNDGMTLTWTSNKTSSKNSQIFMANWNHELALEKIRATILRKKDAPTLDTRSNISNLDLLHYIKKLSSAEYNGRMTGSVGMQKASSFIKYQFKDYGLFPFNEDQWIQEFSFFKKFKINPSSFLNLNGENAVNFELGIHWNPMLFSSNCSLNINDAYFVGYGIQADLKHKTEAFDSYTHLDVKDKWVIALSGYPKSFEQNNEYQYESRFTNKAAIARNLGAKGIIFVNAESNGSLDNNYQSIDHSLSIPSFVVSRHSMEKVFLKNNLNLQEIMETHSNSPYPKIGFEIKDVGLTGKILISKEKSRCVNTIGRIPAFDNSNQTLIIGAHLDHLGTNISFSRKKDKGKSGFHPGADDNLSGIAALLEIAQNISFLVKTGQLKLKFDILFCFWSGEEIGLLGSSHFTDEWMKHNHTKKIVAYLNMDMVGRYKDKLTIHGVGSSNKWSSLIQQANIPISLNLNLQKDSYIPTDTTSFITRKIPILSGFTGLHEDYHMPSDTPDKINYDALQKCAKLFKNIILKINEDPKINFVPQKAPDTSRVRLKAYLGTIPNYGSTDTTGVSLSGVAVDGPADKAGLKGGDIIVELNNNKIESIYDYTKSISKLKPKEKTKITVLRNDMRLELEITPASR